ncbi:hypothetical protein MIMGU_mgv1a013646mg [Erythranthe guttata]|uniref:Uncharacterized protein n=1 Tax=Erythranthe guttata TaxID=4155 RepID=A0A022QUJ7_ERYGU|nr:PREDICTED: protodermal factor 1-like [Erythranthe guttata]EYU31571.1 hypothetical protein MIMGU_mgv1a013646mg [Erythranthe guttata]|eukprot:XP_012844405.1 PREDICTED: protodermal factor 1-like [Erythranthe guttata]
MQSLPPPPQFRTLLRHMQPQHRPTEAAAAHHPAANLRHTPQPGGSPHHHTPTPSHHTPTPSHHTPSTPTPTTPIHTPTPSVTPPITPGITIPSPPFAFDPNSPPFNCTYWKNHPTIVWGLVGWWGTVGNAFGVTGTIPGFGAHLNPLEALTNTRTDGFGELCRQGTAALLNCLAHTKFPLTAAQVRSSFVAALGSDKAAAAQAQIFKLANEGST